MAFPFRSTPLSAYLRWAADAGCTCLNGYSDNGITFWEIVSPAGKKLYIADMDQSEYLVSSQLNYFDRRLGLKSPFERVHGA